uniref:Phosducin thioredoxin-like domain-containing protein n=1 Tax=Aplanochytrium stocchinoi TaxID=215587 RepID=A0A7S3LJ58_9STRA|mmetsp:Transcript_17248/g.21247  ORF Transcript_17248/g.21247 Transcript_17248/m.21247 type:complete len:295 (-) Transcript_17248:384-1268(-)|eukprot:CAMPEP_0204823848 /NCGR_PEP_ID=MMETSP1346-20131115/1920_1 /ASSEMBLY_ACC=CAM_ASM_000771 /TAXON_ID=215587 /ORGANISM="Aplanochytrium stocchinoi, Strain GSBS06" /LENGTH=294 /DNA_ID=CAMNT_0051950677 /DNA_START=219 /DNA_END=1103 /DNA_ORIENTATION=-
MNVGSTNTYKTRKVETTEFEDILVKKGIISERPELLAERLVDEAIKKQSEVEDAKSAEERATEKLKKVAQGSDNELDAYLEGVDEDDLGVERKFLERFRDQRIAELKQKRLKEKFGSVYPIQRADFVKEVTESSKGQGEGKETNAVEDSNSNSNEVEGQWVVVELFKDGIQESSRMSQLTNELSKRQKSTKFVRIRSTECVENWPDSNVPCLFLYNKGSLQSQVIGLKEFGGNDNSSVDKLDWVLGTKYKVFETSCDEDPFKKEQAFKLRRDFVGSSNEHENDDERNSDSDSDW